MINVRKEAKKYARQQAKDSKIPQKVIEECTLYQYDFLQKQIRSGEYRSVQLPNIGTFGVTFTKLKKLVMDFINKAVYADGTPKFKISPEKAYKYASEVVDTNTRVSNGTDAASFKKILDEHNRSIGESSELSSR